MLTIRYYADYRIRAKIRVFVSSPILAILSRPIKAKKISAAPETISFKPKGVPKYFAPNKNKNKS